MPGAQLIGREGDDFLGKVKVKVGPVTSEFNGKAHFVERDREGAPRRDRRQRKGVARHRQRGRHHRRPAARGRRSHPRHRRHRPQDRRQARAVRQRNDAAGIGETAGRVRASRWRRSSPADHAERRGRTCAARIGRRPRLRAEPAPIDLLELAGGGMLKKYGPPVLAAMSRYCWWLSSWCVAADDERSALAAWRRPAPRSRWPWSPGCAPAASWCPQAARRCSCRRWPVAPSTRSQLYWAARLTLVNRVEDLAAFDAVFDAVFGDAVLGVDPPGLEQQQGVTALAGTRRRGRAGAAPDDGGVCRGSPTRPSVADAASDHHDATSGCRTPCPAGSWHAPTNRSNDSMPTICGCLVPGWSRRPPRWPRRRSLRRESAPTWQADRPARDHERVAGDGLGDGGSGAGPPPRTSAPYRAGV